MRVLIMGTGAVGGSYGVMLARAGHEVVFVARGARLAAMRERGLELRRPDDTIVLRPVTAVEAPAAAGPPPELALFTVKTYDTEAAIEALRPAVGPNTTVLTLQNGVDGVERLVDAVGAGRVLAGTTTINAAVPEPGVLIDRGVPTRTTIAELSGEATPRLVAVAAALRDTGWEVVISDDARRILWLKFVLLAPHATLTSACGQAVGAIRSIEEGVALYRQLIEEAVAVGRAEGVNLPADLAATTLAFVLAMPPAARTSMALDFERGGRVELEQITGSIVRRGRALGVPTPGFSALYPVLKVRAVGSRQ